MSLRNDTIRLIYARRELLPYILPLLMPKVASSGVGAVKESLKRSQKKYQQALRKESLPLAVQAYEDLAKAILPYATALEGVRITRSDERRKMKNTVKLLAKIKNRADPSYIHEKVKEFGLTHPVQVEMWWENLEGLAKSLLRVIPRIENYQSLEQSFSWGPFEIENHFGYKPEEYEDALKVLDAASDKLRQAGFGKLLYGKVVLTRKISIGSPLGASGLYYFPTDTISLSVESNFRFDAVYTLVHEFGHRYWNKFLTKKQWDEYEDLAYHGSESSLSVQDRLDMWDAWEKSGYQPRETARLLPRNLQPLWRKYFGERREALGGDIPRPSKYMDSMGYDKETLKRVFTLPRRRWYEIGESSGYQSVTPYGETDIKEDYAEVFAHVVFGMKVDPSILERWNHVMPRSKQVR